MRKALALAVLLFVLASCAGNTLASKDIRFRPGAEEGPITIDLLPIAGWPVITVTLNGVEDVRCLLDTGANVNLLFLTDKIRPLELNAERRLSIGGFGDGPKLSAELAHGLNVELNDATLSGVDFRVSSVEHIPWLTPDGGLDCVLGYDVFHQFAVEIDHKAKKAVFYRKLEKSKVENALAIKLYKSGYSLLRRSALLELQLTHDRPPVHGYFLLDTGFRGSLLYFFDEEQIPEQADEIHIFGVQGVSKQWRIRAQKTLMGDHAFREPDVRLMSPPREKGKRIGSLGTGLLNKGRYIVDYSENWLYFFPYQASPSRFERSARQSFYVTVSLSYPIVFQVNLDAPAEIAAVPKGSRLTQLNGRDIRSYSDEERHGIMQGRSGAEFSFCYQESAPDNEGWGTEQCAETKLELH